MQPRARRAISSALGPEFSTVFEVLAKAQIGLAVLTPKGVFLHANEAFASVLGVPATTVAGLRLANVLAPEDESRVLRPFLRLKRGGPGFTMETRYLRPDGKRRWTQQTFMPLEHPDIVGPAILAVVHDETYVHETKRNLRISTAAQEARLRERTAELNNTIRELEAYNYSVTHDLRTPLRAIRGFVDLLLREPLPTPAATEYLQAVADASRQMTDLIEGLQRLSGMTRVEIRRSDVDLSALVREILARLRAEDPTRAVSTIVQRNVVARADAELVHVLLENLLSNAWKFTRTRSRAIIRFGTRVRNGRTYFFLQDNGVGFDPADASKLFHPFRRLDPNGRFEGTGIGLATVRQVVRRHGGTVVAEGTRGRGATFFFTLSRWESWG